MAQRIGNQQVAEFVVDVGSGYRMMRQKDQPQSRRQNRQSDHAPNGSAREFRGGRGDVRLPDEGHRKQQKRENQFDVVDRPEADGIMQRVHMRR